MSKFAVSVSRLICLQSLLHRPFAERRTLLREHFKEVPGEFAFAKSRDCDTVEEIQTLLEESVKDGCEGLMVKMLESEASHYEPSRRSVNWLKVRTCLRLARYDLPQTSMCSSRRIISRASEIHLTLL
jgi:ATP-dependent DNA ligase